MTLEQAWERLKNDGMARLSLDEIDSLRDVFYAGAQAAMCCNRLDVLKELREFIHDLESAA